MSSLVSVTFIQSCGTPITVQSQVGHSLLEMAREHHIDLEGACEGSLACSTCQVVVGEEWYPKLSQASEDEEDMLDLAFDLQPTSRLGCQIILSPALDGLVVSIPGQSRNIRPTLRV